MRIALISILIFVFVSAKPIESVQVDTTKPIQEIKTDNPYRDAKLMKLKYKILIIELQQELQEDFKNK